MLTCPTAACFNLLDEPTYFKLGRRIAFFGDGWQFRAERFGRKVWVVPILSGEFVLDRRFGYRDGLMGGNLWFMATSADSALLAAERSVQAVQEVPGVILPFPGGIASSGSKAGSRYKFSIASTYEAYCPTLRDKLGEKSKVPGRGRINSGDHHQRPRSADDCAGNAGRHCRERGDAGVDAHLRGELWGAFG